MSSAPPPLPIPVRTRWQPLRIGLVELFHYDSEEFHFHDGHLLLRGNNGSGKSKVLSLTLPFLLDAQLSSARVEPDGDRGKRMDWNLLMGRHERRSGYAWIEFGRLDEQGQPHYLTLGCGLAAVQGRAQVDRWHFITPQRIGESLWLIGSNRSVLNREQLRLAIEPAGGLYFDRADAYRRAVDERLFRLGETRYGALIDLLIQLRQPQLSKKPDEGSLSDALSNALPPLAAGVVGDVAEAMNQLDAYRDELGGYERLHRAVAEFTERYCRYAQVQARRQAKVLRQAQTEFDRASGEVNAARDAERADGAAAAAAGQAVAAIDGQWQHDRAALDALKSDPANLDASRLEKAEREAVVRQREAGQARADRDIAQRRCMAEIEKTRVRADELLKAEVAAGRASRAAHEIASACGIGEPHLALMKPVAPDELQAALRQLAARRDEQLAHLRSRLKEREHARQALERRRGERDVHANTAAQAERAAQAAYQALERATAVLLAAWRDYLQGLVHLQLPESEGALDLLAEWLVTQTGPNPARAAVDAARREAGTRLANRLADADSREQALRQQDAPLAAEQARLLDGRQPEPPLSPTRDAASRGTRSGAPLWALIEFAPELDDAARAGLEAGLQAAGLLDAWVTPNGALLDAGTFDALLGARMPQAANLGRLLRATPNAAVDTARIDALLAGIGCAETDDGSAEAWFSTAGEYRLGPLSGRWAKPQAEFIGATAREAARLKRLAELATLRAEITSAVQQIGDQRRALLASRAALDAEAERAPDDGALRKAHAEQSACRAAHERAQEALLAADTAFESARQALLAAQRQLESDADDLELPVDEAELQAIAQEIHHYRLAIQQLAQAQRDRLRAAEEQAGQQEREAIARDDLTNREAELERRQDAERAANASRDVLRDTLGSSVDALKAKLAALGQAVIAGEKSLKFAREEAKKSGETHAVSQQRVVEKEARLVEGSKARLAAAAQLQGFADTGLLAVALPELAMPANWLVDAALNLARRAEALLVQVDDDDAAWTRIRSKVAEDYTALGAALTAQGQQAAMSQSDYGLIVGVRWQNRAERPDRLSQILADEIEQRRSILTAREREVMENHLQAEVAVSLQRLLREAERQVADINRELHRHPTSTGVRFRLSWETTADDSAEAAAGFEAVRKTLIHRSVDAWSAEDRQAVGAFLQARIASERAQDRGGTLAEHLAAALDYRLWHRFRVQRQQDGQWKTLAGPASSGERALSLTVPLFAAAASHYGSCESPLAPRLVLLDEAFAGIDDEARSHCMALIREFDLDFVMTSEREWGCYATLPGVAICQLQRQEGLDAVYVSRWQWDGRSRQPQPDPARRLPPVAADGIALE